MTARESVTGSSGVASRAGTTICALMIAGTPAAIAARKGASSTRSMVERSTSIFGSPVCESVVVEPWPGKCFAQQKNPAAA